MSTLEALARKAFSHLFWEGPLPEGAKAVKKGSTRGVRIAPYWFMEQDVQAGKKVLQILKDIPGGAGQQFLTCVIDGQPERPL